MYDSDVFYFEVFMVDFLVFKSSKSFSFDLEKTKRKVDAFCFYAHTFI